MTLEVGRKVKRKARVLPGDVVEIPLTQGKVALVDLADFPLVSHYTWCAKVLRRSGCRPQWYVVSKSYGKYVYLTNVITGLQAVDHINCNALDCRRSNIRVATRQQNAANMRMPTNNTSGYKGVQWEKRRRKWIAVIWVAGKMHWLGYHTSKVAAAAAYDRAAVRFFGEFARTNSPLASPLLQ